MRVILLATLIACLSAASSRATPINYLGPQTRDVLAATNFGGDEQGTNDPGPWTASAFRSDGNEFASAAAAALQTSDLAALAITMSGELSASAFSTPETEAEATAVSFLKAVFSVESDTPFTSLLQTDGDTNVSGFSFGDGISSFAPDSSGILTAGNVYTLSIDLRVNAFAGLAGGPNTAAGGYSYSLVVPEPSSGYLLIMGTVFLAMRRRRCVSG